YLCTIYFYSYPLVPVFCYRVFHSLCFCIFPSLPIYTLFPYPTLFRSSTRNTFITTALTTGSVAATVLSGCRLRRPRTAYYGSSRSEEHTSELQSRENLVCRFLLEKKTMLLIATKLIAGYSL